MLSFQALSKSNPCGIIRSLTTGSAQSKFSEFVHLVKDHSQIEEIDSTTLKSSLKSPKVQIVDVRETSELEKGIIPGAICLSRGILEKDIEKNVPITNDVVVYCASGYRSILAAESLKRMGYKVKSLQGGFNGWKNAGNPVTPST